MQSQSSSLTFTTLNSTPIALSWLHYTYVHPTKLNARSPHLIAVAAPRVHAHVRVDPDIRLAGDNRETHRTSLRFLASVIRADRTLVTTVQQGSTQGHDHRYSALHSLWCAHRQRDRLPVGMSFHAFTTLSQLTRCRSTMRPIHSVLVKYSSWSTMALLIMCMHFDRLPAYLTNEFLFFQSQ